MSELSLNDKLTEIETYCESTRQPGWNINSRSEEMRELILATINEIRGILQRGES